MAKTNSRILYRLARSALDSPYMSTWSVDAKPSLSCASTSAYSVSSVESVSDKGSRKLEMDRDFSELLPRSNNTPLFTLMLVQTFCFISGSQILRSSSPLREKRKRIFLKYPFSLSLRAGCELVNYPLNKWRPSEPLKKAIFCHCCGR